MTGIPDIDWHRFRAGTVVGSKMNNRVYEVAAFEYAEQVDIGTPRTVRQNIELELEIEPTGKATPDWWLPNFVGSGGAPYILLDDHAYMLMDYRRTMPMDVLNVELSRAIWADTKSELAPFQQAVQVFRQSLTH